MSKTLKTPSESASEAVRSAEQAANAAAEATIHAIGDAANTIGTAVGDAAKATRYAVGRALKATGEYLTQSKDTAVMAAQETLNGIEKKWQDLQAKAEPTTDEARAYLREAKDQMTRTLTDAKAKLVEAKAAGTDVWQQKVQPALDADMRKAQKLYEDTFAKDLFGVNVGRMRRANQARRERRVKRSESGHVKRV